MSGVRLRSSRFALFFFEKYFGFSVFPIVRVRVVCDLCLCVRRFAFFSGFLSGSSFRDKSF